jgi:hypothetical protein
LGKIERKMSIALRLYQSRAACYNEPVMLDSEKAASETTPRSDSQAWADFLSQIEGFIDFKCTDRHKCYVELKEFAEKQLARLGVAGETIPPDLKDELMPEISQKRSALDASPPIRPESLNELLAAVVDDPETWLSTPSAQLGWRKPGDLIGTDEEV